MVAVSAHPGRGGYHPAWLRGIPLRKPVSGLLGASCGSPLETAENRAATVFTRAQLARTAAGASPPTPTRTALTYAFTVAAVPKLSPPDLRHRGVSLLHWLGCHGREIGEQVGHDDLVTTARTSTHVVAGERELEYAMVLSGGRG